MENNNSKILTLSFASTAALCGFTLHLLIKSFSAAFGIVARMADTDVVRHGVPVVSGLIIFAVLQFNPKILSWADDVVSELRKTVFPSRKETTSMTIAVIIMVLLSALIVAAFDVTSGAALNWLLKI